MSSYAGVTIGDGIWVAYEMEEAEKLPPDDPVPRRVDRRIVKKEQEAVSRWRRTGCWKRMR